MKFIVGLDEVGRGPLAGPVVAAATVFPESYQNPEIRDSKRLSPKTRTRLAAEIKQAALAWAVVPVGHRRIDTHNILQASRMAMTLALRRVLEAFQRVDLVLVDGNVLIDLPPNGRHLPQRAVIGGDDIHVQISAASILAKVWRDKLMHDLDARFPGYGFKRNAGYPTPEHRQALSALGPCFIHRRSFNGVNSERRRVEHSCDEKDPRAEIKSPPPPDQVAYPSPSGGDLGSSA